MQIEDKNKKASLNERINQIWSTTQGKTYTTAIATLVVVVLMIVLAIVPAYMSITDQISLNEQKTKYVQDISTKQKNLNSLLIQQQDNAVGIQLLDIYFHNKIDNELIVASFSEIAAKDNIKCDFSNVSFTDPATSKKIKNLNANIKAIGFSAKFMCKIGVIQDVYESIIKLPVPIYIDGISYTNRKDQGGGGSSNFFFDKFAVTYSGEYYYWNGAATTNTSTSTIN